MIYHRQQNKRTVDTNSTSKICTKIWENSSSSWGQWFCHIVFKAYLGPEDQIFSFLFQLLVFLPHYPLLITYNLSNYVYWLHWGKLSQVLLKKKRDCILEYESIYNTVKAVLKSIVQFFLIWLAWLIDCQSFEYRTIHIFGMDFYSLWLKVCVEIRQQNLCIKMLKSLFLHKNLKCQSLKKCLQIILYVVYSFSQSHLCIF